MMIVDQLVVEHQTLRNKAAENPGAVNMPEIMAFMDQVQAASAHVESPPQREHLQAILFHWNGYVYNQTGVYPGVQLTAFSPSPAAPDAGRTAHVTTTRPNVTLPQVHWLVWAIAIILFVGGVIIVIWPLLFSDGEAAAAPTAQAEAVFTAVAATQTTIAQEAAATRAAIEQTADAAALMFVTATSSSEITTAEATLPTGPVTYIVQAGDTLFAIAGRYGVTTADIMTRNGLISESLMVGQTLILPNPPLTPLAGTAVATPPLPTATPLAPGQQLAEMVIRAADASLYSGPGAEFSIIMPLPRGAFAYAVGQNQAGDWYLVQLEDGVTRGWLPAASGGLLYPAVPEAIPVVIVP